MRPGQIPGGLHARLAVSLIARVIVRLALRWRSKSLSQTATDEECEKNTADLFVGSTLCSMPAPRWWILG
jgi:hypothetical protein